MRRASLVCLVVVSAMVSVGGCAAGGSDGPEPSVISQGSTTAGAGGAGGDDFVPTDEDPVTTTNPGEEEDCGRQDFNVARKPADILLVLDRSASMKDDPSGGDGSPSKWEIVVPALQEVISATDSAVAWGLKVFPQGERAGSCSEESFPSDIAIPIAEKNASTVNSAISATTDEGDGTPTGDAILKATEYMQTIQNDHVKYFLLATDGDPSCPSDADEYAVQAITDAANAGYHTFVVGVASNASKIKTLNSLAVAGLEPRMDPDPLAPKFYLASTKDQLVAAFESITGAVASCLFPLSSAPPNPDHVGVLIGDQKVPQDTTGTNGWDYTGPDKTAIKLYGAACDQVTASGAETVQVIFGCKDDPIY